MSESRSRLVTLRLRCCACGHVERFTVAARAAFAFADELLRSSCGAAAASQGRRCDSRDRRLELRPA